MNTMTTKKAGDLWLGDKVCELAGVIWTVDNVVYSSRSVEIHLVCDEADSCIVRPEPTVIKIGNNRLVNVLA